MSASLSVIARRFNFVRETEGPNAGYWVDFFLRFTGNVEGESWCASFVSRVEDIATKGKMRFTKTASTQALLAECRLHGWVVPYPPMVDDLVFSLRPDGVVHHVGIVTLRQPLTSIAGNTDETGTSSNGTGVFEHQISETGKVFVRLP